MSIKNTSTIILIGGGTACGKTTIAKAFSEQYDALVLHHDRYYKDIPHPEGYNFDEPDTVLQEFEKVIFDQDKRIVESQRPIQVPFDLSEELHLKFDTVAMNYRRAMKKNKLHL